MTRGPRSISARIAQAGMLTALVAILVSAIATPSIVREQELAVVGTRLISDASLVADALAPLVGGDAESVDRATHRLAAAAGLRVTVIDPRGVVIGESDEDRRLMENHADRPEVATALAGGTGRSVRASATVGKDLEYVAVPIRTATGQVAGVARVAVPLADVTSYVDRILGALVIAAIVATLTAVALALLLGRTIARPIVRLRQAAGGGGAFAVDGPPEVTALAAALQRMSDDARAAHATASGERDRLATLLAELDDAVMFADRGEVIRVANAAAETFVGARPLVGRRLVEVIRDHEILDAIDQARAGGEATVQVERDLPQRVIRATAKTLAGGELLISLHDLTSFRRLETVRRDFVANVSHELRTPIASLKAMAETLEEGAIDDPAASRDFIGRMHQEIDGLAILVNELLSLTRIESGDDRLTLAPVAPDQLLRDAAARIGPLAVRAGVTVTVAITPGLPPVSADAPRIGQVLTDLAHNAVKFTPRGGSVQLSAVLDAGAVRFAVHDTGCGIAGADLDRVFERFYKADPARGAAGTGLGLAIAKHLVQAHGGTIRAESDGLGRGATFSFTVPVA